MQSGDGLVVRVRPHGGRLTQAQAAGIATLAAQYGNGLIDLSARANVQLRGVRADTHAPLIAGLADLGLIDPSLEAETRRNVIVTPYWQHDDGTAAVTAQLIEALREDDDLALPGKFGFAIDTGLHPVLRNISADIRCERDGAGRLLCRADGATHGALIAPEDVASTALALTRWFLDSGGVKNGRGRMAAHLAAGAQLPAIFAAYPAQILPSAPIPRPGRVAGGFMVGLAFGQMEAPTMAALADLATLRITPWRMVLLEGVEHAPDLPGLIVEADDPLLRVIACPGAPACLQALQPTRPIATALAPYLPADALLHVSGCAKGCAHPQAAPLTLVAGADGFDLIRAGPADGGPALCHLTYDQLRSHPDLLTEYC